MHYKKYAALPHEEKWNGFTLDYKYIEGFSPLFYETDGTHWDLDHDADRFLWDVIFRYWIDCEDSPEPETLYLKALADKNDQIVKDRKEFFYSSEYFQSKDRDPVEDVLRGNKADRHPDEIKFTQLGREAELISSKIYRFIPEYLREVIATGMMYHGEINKQQKYEDTKYNRAIIHDPGVLLLQYFHDQLVFDNYVQIITVPRLEEKAIRLLESGVLLEPLGHDPYGWNLDRIMDVVANCYRGWWT